MSHRGEIRGAEELRLRLRRHIGAGVGPGEIPVARVRTAVRVQHRARGEGYEEVEADVEAVSDLTVSDLAGGAILVSPGEAGDCANAMDASKAEPATPAMAYLTIMIWSPSLQKTDAGEHATSTTVPTIVRWNRRGNAAPHARAASRRNDRDRA